MSLTPEAQAIAERRAAEDRDTLARLLAAGKVQRKTGDYERGHPEVARPFIADIERRAGQRRRDRGMDTIRPKQKRRRR